MFHESISLIDVYSIIVFNLSINSFRFVSDVSISRQGIQQHNPWDQLIGKPFTNRWSNPTYCKKVPLHLFFQLFFQLIFSICFSIFFSVAFPVFFSVFFLLTLKYSIHLPIADPIHHIAKKYITQANIFVRTFDKILIDFLLIDCNKLIQMYISDTNVIFKI